jgi:hypothetical protein
MNFSVSIHSKLIPENAITEIRWVAWNSTNEVSGIISLTPANPEKFIPIERVDYNTMLKWVSEKLDLSQIEKQLNH